MPTDNPNNVSNLVLILNEMQGQVHLIFPLHGFTFTLPLLVP